jgi:hypothetical protein
MIDIELECYRQIVGVPSSVAPEELRREVGKMAIDVDRNWGMLKTRIEDAGILTHIRLLFVPWKRVKSPRCAAPGAMLTMSGFPLFEYKELDGKVFYLRPVLITNWLS